MAYSNKPEHPTTSTTGVVQSIQVAEGGAGWLDARLAALMERHRDFILSRIRRNIYDAQKAEDIAQEVFTGTFHWLSRSPTFATRLTGDDYRKYLNSVCTRRIMDHRRREARRAEMDREWANGERRQGWARKLKPREQLLLRFLGSPQGLASEERAVCRRAWSEVELSFEPTSLEIFHAYARDGDAPDVLAERFGKSVNSIYILKSKVLAAWRDALQRAGWRPEEPSS